MQDISRGIIAGLKFVLITSLESESFIKLLLINEKQCLPAGFLHYGIMLQSFPAEKEPNATAFTLFQT